MHRKSVCLEKSMVCLGFSATHMAHSGILKHLLEVEGYYCICLFIFLVQMIKILGDRLFIAFKFAEILPWCSLNRLLITRLGRWVRG